MCMCGSASYPALHTPTFNHKRSVMATTTEKTTENISFSRRNGGAREVEVRKHRLLKGHSREVTNTTKCSKFQRVILFPRRTLGRKINIIRCQTHTSWLISPETQSGEWPTWVCTGTISLGYSMIVQHTDPRTPKSKAVFASHHYSHYGLIILTGNCSIHVYSNQSDWHCDAKMIVSIRDIPEPGTLFENGSLNLADDWWWGSVATERFWLYIEILLIYNNPLPI